MKPAKCPSCGQTLTLSMNGWIQHRLAAFKLHYPKGRGWYGA